MSTKYTLLPSLCRVIPNPSSKPPDNNEQVSSSQPEETTTNKEEEKMDDKPSVLADREERELGLSDMTETEASGSEEEDNESKLVIADDSSNKVPIRSRLLSKDLDSTRVRSLEETMKFLQGNTSIKSNTSSLSQDQDVSQDMSVDSEGDEDGEGYDDDSDGEIVVSSTGAPDKYGFLTEIYVPKMRGFEDLSDRCILDSVSVNLTLDQVVRSNMDQFNHYMRNPELTDTQKEITKYVRRRARNRVSARKSRMKKISDIVRLSQEIKVIRQKKESLKNEKLIMDKLKLSWKKRVAILEDFILEYLREHGERKDIMLDYQGNEITVVKDEHYEEKIRMQVEKKKMLEEVIKLEEEKKKQSLLQPKINPKTIVIKKVQLVKGQMNKNDKHTLLFVKNNKDESKTSPQESLLHEGEEFCSNDLQDYLVSKLQDTQTKLEESLLNNAPEIKEIQPCLESTKNETGNNLENSSYGSDTEERIPNKGLHIPAQIIDQKDVQEGLKIKIKRSNKDKPQQYLQSIISENLQSIGSQVMQHTSLESIPNKPPKKSLLKNSKTSLIKIQKNSKSILNNEKGSFDKSDLKILEDNPELKTLLLNRNKNNMINQKSLLVTKRPFTLSANKEYFDNKKVKISTTTPNTVFKENKEKIITNKFINVSSQEKLNEPERFHSCPEKDKIKPGQFVVRNVIRYGEHIINTNESMLVSNNRSIGSKIIRKNEVAKSIKEQSDSIKSQVLETVNSKDFSKRVVPNNKNPEKPVKRIVIKKDDLKVIAKNIMNLESKLIAESIHVKNTESKALSKTMVVNNEEPNLSADIKIEDSLEFDDKIVIKEEESEEEPNSMVMSSEETKILSKCVNNVKPEIIAKSVTENNPGPIIAESMSVNDKEPGINSGSIRLTVKELELKSECIDKNNEPEGIVKSKVDSKIQEDNSESIVINADHKESEVPSESISSKEPKVIVESIFGNNREHKRSVNKINFIEESKFLEDNLIHNIVDEAMDISE